MGINHQASKDGAVLNSNSSLESLNKQDEDEEDQVEEEDDQDEEEGKEEDDFFFNGDQHQIPSMQKQSSLQHRSSVSHPKRGDQVAVLDKIQEVDNEDEEERNQR